MKIICEVCGHKQKIDAPRVMGAAGGKKSRRIITPEQQAMMQERRKELRKNAGSTPARSQRFGNDGR